MERDGTRLLWKQLETRVKEKNEEGGRRLHANAIAAVDGGHPMTKNCPSPREGKEGGRNRLVGVETRI